MASVRKRIALILLMLVLATTSAYTQVPSRQVTFPSTTVWVTHFKDDILPYWVMDDALGTPIGNFPMLRNMLGKKVGQSSDRYVRTMARQVYVYFIGYSLTGDEKLLTYAKKGLDWIDKRAVHANKGFYTKLDGEGKPIARERKSAQDIAYIALAYSADYFVTRNPDSQRRLDEVIELIFNGPFWSKQKGIIIDALDEDLVKEVEFENPGTDIVSLLDQVNAYLLLYSNQGEPDSKKRELLYKLRILGDLLIVHFYSDRIFWNTDLNRSDYGAKHVDTGHTMKTYWMLHRINTLWQAEFKYPLYGSVLQNIKPLMIQAYGGDSQGFWGMRFSPQLGIVKTNPDWWIQIELDQLAADLSILDKAFVEMLDNKANVWLTSNFIDRSRPVRGIREGIRWDNSLYGDDDSWTSKANEWKNGYHETEHCFVLHIASHAILGKPLTLYFALSDGQDAAAVQPYIFLGNPNLSEIKDYGEIKDDGLMNGVGLRKIAITFDGIR